MTIIREARCDGPDCFRKYALHDRLERDGLPTEAGWQTSVFGSVVNHFCSFACMSRWAAAKEITQQMIQGKNQQVGTSQHHGTKLKEPF